MNENKILERNEINVKFPMAKRNVFMYSVSQYW